ncbi:MAG: hypothetical protein ACPGJV_07755 [Bacteriovoracaceae bacterium]
MKVYRNLFQVLFVAIVLTACGSDDPQRGFGTAKKGGPAPLAVPPTANKDEMYRMMQNVKQFYTAETEIPKEAALLYFSKYDKRAGKYRGGQCSSSLVGKDIILTNAHCIPDDLKLQLWTEGKANCEKRIVAHFPKFDGPTPNANGHYKLAYDTFDCSEVLFSSNNGLVPTGFQWPRDYALIKLKTAPERPALRHDFTGFQEDEVYTTLSMDPIGDNRPDLVELYGKGGSFFVKKKCVAKENTAYLNTSEYPHGPSASLFECTAIQGNSGSAVIDSNKVLKGVLWGAPKYKLDPRNYPPADGTFLKPTIITSINCMKPFNPPANPLCDEPERRKKKSLFDVFDKDYAETSVDGNTTQDASSLFGFQVLSTVVNGKTVFLGQPECVNDFDQSAEYFNTPGNEIGEMDLPVYDVHRKYNQYGQTVFSLEQSSTIDFDYVYRMEGVSEGLTTVTLYEKTNQTELKKFKVPVCTTDSLVLAP